MELVKHSWGQLSVYRYSGPGPSALLRALQDRINEVSSDFRSKITAWPFHTLGSTDLLVVTSFNNPQLFDASLLLPGQRNVRSEGFQAIFPGVAAPVWMVPLGAMGAAVQGAGLPVTALFSLRFAAVGILLRPADRPRSAQVLALGRELLQGLHPIRGAVMTPLLGLDRSDMFLLVQAARLEVIAELEQALAALTLPTHELSIPVGFLGGSEPAPSRLLASVQLLIGMPARPGQPEWVGEDQVVGADIRATSIVRWEPDAERIAREAFLQGDPGRRRLGGGRVVVRWPPRADRLGGDELTVKDLMMLLRRPEKDAPRVFQDTSVQILSDGSGHDPSDSRGQRSSDSPSNGAAPGPGGLWAQLNTDVECLAQSMHRPAPRVEGPEAAPPAWTHLLREASLTLGMPWGLKHELRDMTIRLSMLLETEPELSAVGLPVVDATVALLRQASEGGLASKQAIARLSEWGLLRSTITAINAILAGGAAPALLDGGPRALPPRGPQCGAFLAVDAICGLVRMEAQKWGLRGNPLVHLTIDARPWVELGPAEALFVRVPASDRLEPFDLALGPAISTAVLGRASYFDLAALSDAADDGGGARRWARALAEAHGLLALRAGFVLDRRSLLACLRDAGDLFVHLLPKGSRALPLARSLRRLCGSLPALLGSAPPVRRSGVNGAEVPMIGEADEAVWFFEAGPVILRETLARLGGDRVATAALGVLIATSVLQSTRTLPGLLPDGEGWLAADLALRLRWACMSEAAFEAEGRVNPGISVYLRPTMNRLMALQQDLRVGGERFIAELGPLLSGVEALVAAEPGSPEAELALLLGAWHRWVVVWACHPDRDAGRVALGRSWADTGDDRQEAMQDAALEPLERGWERYIHELRGEGGPWLPFADLSELSEPAGRQRLVARRSQRRLAHDRVLLRTGGRGSLIGAGVMEDLPPPESALMQAAAGVGGRHLLGPLLRLVAEAKRGDPPTG